MGNYDNEEMKVERPALEQLTKQGWRYVAGADLLPREGGERAYLRDVVLVECLSSALRRLNPWISDENLAKVMRMTTHPNAVGLMEYNHDIYEKLVNYLSVDQDLGKGRKGQTVKIIDFDTPSNNDFVCCNQFRVEGNTGAIIPDIVCFVNGLPLAVIECKSPYIANGMGEGIDQLRRYANLREPMSDEGAPKLFWYNQLMVCLCRGQAQVGTISSSGQYYSDWKDAYPYSDADIALSLGRSAEGAEDDVTAQERLLAGLFRPAQFLDIVRNFIIFEPVEGRLVKKVARYQQYRAVNKVIDRLKSGADRREQSGIIWHTQGSGKSLTMVMLAIKMRRDPVLRQYKLVFVTDRTQLDAQLSSTFRAAQSETIYNADSVADLRDLLRRDASDIVTSTVQKFQEAQGEGDFEDINLSEKIVVLADEAHRTQFGHLAATINGALPNAPKIGFTGTPLLRSQKMDRAFGGYIDQYKINEAVEDGATVRIIYEGRQVKSAVVGNSLEALFDAYFEDCSDEVKNEIRKKYGVERAVREAPARIRWVCIDLLEHYRQKVMPDGFKAMIVVGSRYAATLFKESLDALGAPPSEVIISGTHNDPPRYKPYTDRAKQKQVIQNFIKPFGTDREKEDPTAFLIVKDMLLTGFDAPIAQVMYIDRSLKEHTLMQAIARVNRTYPGKSVGYVVDYHGLSEHLTDALEMFSSEDVEGTYHTLKDEIPRLETAHRRVAAIFKELKRGKDVDTCVLFLKDEERRQDFHRAFKKFAKQMDVVLPDVAAKPYVADLQRWGKVQHAARTRYRDPGLNLKELGQKVRQLVEEHIISTGVDPKIPPIDLMAGNFRDALAQIMSPESRASEIESAIKHHLNVKMDEDPDYYKSLSRRLEEIIEASEDNWEKQVQILLTFRDELDSERSQKAQDLGLSDVELAFYNTLMAEVTRFSDVDSVDMATHDDIKATCKSLVADFEEATQIVDFFEKPDEIKRMERKIKRSILGYNYGDKALTRVMQKRFIELAQTHYRPE